MLRQPDDLNQPINVTAALDTAWHSLLREWHLFVAAAILTILVVTEELFFRVWNPLYAVRWGVIASLITATGNSARTSASLIGRPRNRQRLEVIRADGLERNLGRVTRIGRCARKMNARLDVAPLEKDDRGQRGRADA